MEPLRELMIVYRVKNGLSMRELAEKCGVSYPTIQRVESGRGKPNRATVAKILAVIKN